MLRQILVGTMVLGLTGSVLAEGAVKIGVIDLLKVYQESEQFKEANVAVQSKFGDRDKKLAEEAEALRGKAEKFRKDKAVMRAKTQEEEENKLKAEQEALTERYTTFQKEYAELNRTLVGDIQKDLERSIRLVAESKKLDVVLNLQSISYYNKTASLDITIPVAKKMAEFAKIAGKTVQDKEVAKDNVKKK